MYVHVTVHRFMWMFIIVYQFHNGDWRDVSVISFSYSLALWDISSFYRSTRSHGGKGCYASAETSLPQMPRNDYLQSSLRMTFTWWQSTVATSSESPRSLWTHVVLPTLSGGASKRLTKVLDVLRNLRSATCFPPNELRHDTWFGGSQTWHPRAG